MKKAKKKVTHPVIRFLIKVFASDYHLAHNPPKGRKYGPDPDALQGHGAADPGEGMAFPEDPPVAF